MKFICSTSLLLKKLQLLAGIIPSKVIMEITDCFLFNIEEGILTITSTDLEVSIRTTQKVEAQENGKIAIPSKLILEILKALPEQPVTFDVDEENLHIEITANSGKYSIACQSAEDFPKFFNIEGGEPFVLPSGVFGDAINATSYSISTDEHKPAITGLLCQISPQDVRFVSTDANKLVLFKRTDVSATKEDSFIIPKKVLTLTKNVLPIDRDEKINFEYSRINAKIQYEDTIIVFRLIDDKFPDYQAIIPKDTPNKLKIQRTDLLAAIKRMIIFSNQSTGQINFSIVGNELNLLSRDLDHANEARERLICEYVGNDMDISFGGKHLISMLSSLGCEEIEMGLSMVNRPCVLTPVDAIENEEILILLMPMLSAI